METEHPKDKHLHVLYHSPRDGYWECNKPGCIFKIMNEALEDDGAKAYRGHRVKFISEIVNSHLGEMSARTYRLPPARHRPRVNDHDGMADNAQSVNPHKYDKRQYGDCTICGAKSALVIDEPVTQNSSVYRPEPRCMSHARSKYKPSSLRLLPNHPASCNCHDCRDALHDIMEWRDWP